MRILGALLGAEYSHLFENFPEEREFLTEELCEIDDEYSKYDPEYHGETIQKSDIPWEYEHEYGFDEPNVVGCNYEFDIKTIFRNKAKYSAFVDIIENDYFDYREEYDEARKYLEQLLEKQNPKSQNLFDLFQ